jgi:hypothetical protein
MTKNKKYKQGVFKPTNPNKYNGTLPIFYRSGLELKSFRWMDNSENVLRWGSESVVIPYQSLDGKIHRYFIDLVCEMKRKDGNIKKYIIEIKPENQTKPPTQSNKKSKKTLMYESYQWAINQAKWKSAENWAKSKGYEFLILTEKHLNG